MDDLSISWLPHSGHGKLIAVSGLDGSGKTTSVGMIMRYLEERNIEAVAVKFPSTEIRRLSYFTAYAMDHRAFEGGRGDLFSLCLVLDGDNLMTLRTKVLPCLMEGKVVVCDRFVYESVAELFGHGADPEDLRMMIAIYSRFPKPDLGFITDVSVTTSISRVASRPDEKDYKIRARLWERFADGFRRVAKHNGLVALPTTSLEETERCIRRHMDGLFGERSISG